MNTKQQKALDKIKKCLKLAGSSNPGEAEAAMRQAKALMEKFGLDNTDVELSAVEEKGCQSSAVSSPVRFEAWLAEACAKAFDCRVIFSTWGYGHKGQWNFIGVEPTPDLAAYCFDVLLRQLKKDRKTYQDTQLKRFGRKNKTAMADQFAESWVMAVEDKIKQFNSDPARKAKVKQYLDKKHQNLGTLKPSVNAGSINPDTAHNARQSGYQAGKNAQLNRAVNGGNAAKSLGNLS